MPTKPDGGYFARPLPRIIAHRGLALDAPENTKLAFVKALSLGITYLETDVQVSADGVAVVSHDADLKRMAGRNVRVDQLTMAELARVDLGNAQGFSSLADVLDSFPEARFNIDIKVAAAVEPVISVIREARAQQRVLIASFDEKHRAAAVKALPGVVSSASSAIIARTLVALRLGQRSLIQAALRGVDAVQVPERHRGVRIVTERNVRLLKAAGVEVHVWTVNEPADMTRLLDMGVDGLVTDRSDLALELLTRRPEHDG